MTDTSRGVRKSPDENDSTAGRSGLTRRAALLAVAAGAGAAAGIGVAAAVDDAGPGAPTPGEELMSDHGVLKRVLLVYRELSRRALGHEVVPASTLGGAAALIQSYIEGVHERLEEQYVFPVVHAQPQHRQLVETLLIQHGAGRKITAELRSLAAGADLTRAATRAHLAARLDAFVAMYEPHEAREDTVVFPALRELLDDRKLAGLAERFAAFERKQLGANAFDRAVAQVSALEESVGIGDLAKFTPA